MASNEGGEPGRQLPDASELGAASERFRPVSAREANLAAADEIAIWQAFALRWQTRSGRRLADRGRLLAVSVVLSPVLFCAVAAILLVASGHGIVGNLVVSDAAAGGLVVGLLPYGIAKCGPRPRLMYRDSETADWTLAVSASQLALERALPDGSRVRVEIDCADAGDLDADCAASHGTISIIGRANDKPSSITVDDRRVATDPALGRVGNVALTAVLSSWWPDNVRAHDGLVALPAAVGFLASARRAAAEAGSLTGALLRRIPPSSAVVPQRRHQKQ
jgi:hypothetical protein